MNNKMYSEPEIEITEFDTKDVIITSAPELEDDKFPYSNLKQLK